VPSLELLYHDVVIEHFRRPRGRDRLGGDAVHRGNPFCGDDVWIHIDGADDRLVVGAKAHGCAISIASASIASELLTGRSGEQGATLVASMLERLDAARAEGTAERPAGLPVEAEVLLAVRSFPTRLDCAKLPWQAASEALARRRPAPALR